MNNLLSYSGIITKAKAMEAKFISVKDYQDVANFETTVDFIGYLKNHVGYRDVFGGIDEEGTHRSQAEGIFINGLYQEFSKLYQFANLEQRKVLDLLFFRYEVNILKACMHMVYNREADYDLSIFSDFFNKHSKLNVKALSSAKSMDEFINLLKGTEYYTLLTTIQKTEITSFDYEMKLDVHYFMKSWKLKDKLLKGDNLKALTNAFGTEIDLLNIIWLFRSKKFYALNTSDNYSYIIPVTYKLTKDKLVKMMETTTMEEFIAVLNTTHYEALSPSLLDGSIEVSYEKMISKVYEINKMKYPTSMAPICYYLFKKENEVRKLITALECVRYKLDPQDTLKYVLQ